MLCQNSVEALMSLGGLKFSLKIWIKIFRKKEEVKTKNYSLVSRIDLEYKKRGSNKTVRVLLKVTLKD